MASDKGNMILFVGFSPDMDPLTPGIWLDCDGLVGTMKGFRPEPGDVFSMRAPSLIWRLYDRAMHEMTYDEFGTYFLTYGENISVLYGLPVFVYLVVFGDPFISITLSPGLAVGGIVLNDGWVYFISDGVAQHSQGAFTDTAPWDESHTLFVDSDEVLQYVY